MKIGINWTNGKRRLDLLSHIWFYITWIGDAHLTNIWHKGVL